MKRWIILLPALLLAATLAAPIVRADGTDDTSGNSTSGSQDSGKKSDKKGDKKGDKDSSPYPAYTGPKRRVAVTDLDDKVSIPGSLNSGLTEILITELLHTGRYTVIERKEMDSILKEHQLGGSGLVNPNTAPKIGQLLGAELLVSGAVTEYSYNRDNNGGGISIGGVHLGGNKADAAIALDIRVYDVTTGEILDSETAEGKATRSGGVFDLTHGNLDVNSHSFNESAIGTACRKAIQQCVIGITKNLDTQTSSAGGADKPWEGKVADVDSDAGKVSAIYLKASGPITLKVGDQLEVLRPGDEIRDPDTGQVLGRKKDKHMGTCKVSTVTDKLITATPVEGDGFKPGDIVHLVVASDNKPQ